jgi:hypothetical protein
MNAGSELSSSAIENAFYSWNGDGCFLAAIVFFTDVSSPDDRPVLSANACEVRPWRR